MVNVEVRPEKGVAVFGPGDMGAGAFRLLTDERHRLLQNQEVNLKLLQLFARPIKKIDPGDVALNILRRANIIGSSESWPANLDDDQFRVEKDEIIVNNQRVKFTMADILNPNAFKELNPDVVALLDTTGALGDVEAVKKALQGIPDNEEGLVMVITNVVKGKGDNKISSLIVGVNEDEYEPKAKKEAISNVSCTTKALAAACVDIFTEYGLPSEFDADITHGWTSSQKLFGEAEAKDGTKSRSADSIIDSTTNASDGLKEIFPGIEKACPPNGFKTKRVPDKHVSVAEITMHYPTTKNITAEKISDLLKAKSKKYPQVVGYTNKNRVSKDYEFATQAAIIEENGIQVYEKDGRTVVKLKVWYSHDRGSQAQAIYLAEYATARRNGIKVYP